MTLSRAYLSDITKGKDRTKKFGYMGVIFGIGMFIGPAVGGFLATISYRIPPLISAGMTLLTCVFLRETVTDGYKIKIRFNDFFPMNIFLRGLREPKLKKTFI